MKKIAAFVVLSLAFACTNQTQNKQAFNVSKLIADKIIRETAFEFQEVPLGANAGLVQLKLEKNETINLTVINQDEEAINGFLGLSFNGSLNLQVNDEDILNDSSTELNINEYTYNRYKFRFSLPLEWQEKSNSLTITNTSSTDSCYIIMLAISAIDEADVRIKIEAPAFDLSLKELVIKESNSYTRDSYADWHYANGGTMLGMLSVYESSKDKTYLNFVQDFANLTIDNKDYFEKQYFQKHAMRGSYHRIFRKTMLDDTGGPAIPFAELACSHGKADAYSALLDEMLDYVLNQQDRLDDSTLCRPEPEDQTIWADDLFMAVPFILRMAELRQDSSLYNEVSRQIINFNSYLRNPETGLYFHGWYNLQMKNTSVQWGRANGWVAWAISEALMMMPENHPDYTEVLDIFQQHMKAIAAVQDESGMWHQVLDLDATFEETSCTAMFTLAMARGVRMNWLDESYKGNALHAWRALQEKIKDDGTVIDICRGTGIGSNPGFYEARKRFDHDPRGLGAMLTAGCEISMLEK